MEVIKHTFDVDAPIRIMPLSDLHLGDAHCDAKLVRSCIDTIMQDDNMYTVLDGDLMNTAIAGSKSDVYGETMPPMEQLERCTEIFKPLADSGKILAVLTGNHEERIARSVGVNMTQVMSKQLGLSDVYSSTSTLLFLRFGKSKRQEGRRQVYSVYINHGNGGGGRRAGSKVNAMEDMAKIITADVYVMGHTHQPASFRKCHYMVNPSNQTVSLREQLFVNTAAFLDWDGSYGDRAGYQPNSKVPPIITLDNERHFASVQL